MVAARAIIRDVFEGKEIARGNVAVAQYFGRVAGLEGATALIPDGAKIEIPTPDGPVRMRVPPGTQSGQCLRLRGRGAPSMRSGVRGDLIVEVRLVLPALLDERSKGLLREFGQINGQNVRQGWGA